MTKNPILDELHETRRRLLAEAGGTLEGLVAGLRKRQRESGRKILETRRTIKSLTSRPTDEDSPLESI